MPANEDQAFLRRALESSIGLVLFLVVWCFELARPFFTPIVWGIILAIATQPIYRALCRGMGGRSSIAASILVVGALLVLIVPSVLITTNLVESVAQLAEKVEAGTLEVPPPPTGRSWATRSTPSGRRLRGISTRRSIRSTRS
jgi:predicted PurR-regulated permease PerM